MQNTPVATLEQLAARRHERLECSVEVDWQLTQRGISGRGLVVNIGLGGACILLPIHVRGPETISFRFPDAQGGTLSLTGRTIWSSGDDEASPSRTGVQFINMGDQERRDLDALLRRMLAARG